MILSLYITRRFVTTLALVFTVFFGILLLIDVIEQLRRFSGRGAGLFDALHLSLLNVPESIYRILPLIFVMSAIALFLSLSRSSELVVVRAAGRSGLRFLVTPVFVALVTGCLAVAVLNPLVAATSRHYDTLANRYANNGASVMSISKEGLWLRQGDATGQTVIRAARASTDVDVLYGVSFWGIAPDGTPLQRIEAKTATLEQGAWVLDKAKRWDLSLANPETSVETLADAYRLPSELTVERIRDSFGTPSAIPFWQLPSYIGGLTQAGFDARSYNLWLQMELAQPLLLAAMVLVAAGFTMRHMRAGKTGIRVLYAILAGFALFFLRNFAQALGESGQVPIFLAAWAPPAMAVLFALGLLLHLEDG